MSSPEIPPKGGDPKALIQQVVQAQLQNPQAQDLVLKQGKVLKQVSQQPKEDKRAEPRPDEGGGKGGLTLEQKRMQAEPGDKPKLISVGVEVNGKHALNGDLSDLQVVALVAPGVSSGKQRIYAQQGASYYTMQTGGSGKKKRLIFAEDLAEAQQESQAGTLLFQGTISSKEEILAGASPKGSASPPIPQPKQLQQSQQRITLESGCSNLYVRNNFLITVAGEQYWYLRVPAPNNGNHYAWFFVVSTPNNSTPDSPKPVTGEVMVMSAFGAFSVGGSGQAYLQWAGGKITSAGKPASAQRALEVDDLPALLAGGRIHEMYTKGNTLILIVDMYCVDDFGLAVVAQPRPPATQEQREIVGQIERALQRLNSSFRRNTALYDAAGGGAATGMIVVELGRGVHLSIMAADLQYAIQSVDHSLQWDEFIGRVFALCPYHVTKGQEHWHSAQQYGSSAYLSGSYSNDRTPQERWQLPKSADDLDWAAGQAYNIGFTIS